MSFEESTTRTKPKTQLDQLAEAEKRRAIAAYQAQFKRDCPCHCHLAEKGIACGCAKDCEHCRPIRNADAVGPHARAGQ